MTGCNDGIGRLWDVSSGNMIQSFSGHTAALNNVTFSADGHDILTSSDNGTARLWALAQNNWAKAIPTTTVTKPAVTTNSEWSPQFQSFDGVDMVLVPPGCFVIGSPDSEIAALNQQYNTDVFKDGAQTVSPQKSAVRLTGQPKIARWRSAAR